MQLHDYLDVTPVPVLVEGFVLQAYCTDKPLLPHFTLLRQKNLRSESQLGLCKPG